MDHAKVKLQAFILLIWQQVATGKRAERVHN